MEGQQDAARARLGTLVREYRRTAGLTQRQLAERSGLSVAAVRDLEQGRRYRPRPGSLAALADALGLDSRQMSALAAAGDEERPAPVGRGDGLWLTALGPLAGWLDGLPLGLGPPRRREVLGLLALQPGELVRRETVIEALWGQQPPATAAVLVQAHVSRLRWVLDPGNRGGLLEQGKAGYRLRAGAGQLDVAAFTELTDLRLLLQINKVVTLGNLNQYEQALAVARQARHLAGQAGTTLRLTQAHGVLGQLFFETGRWDDALTEAAIMPEDLKEPTVACCDLSIVAVICFHRGETAAARRHLAAAVPHAERIGHRLIGPLSLARSLDREHAGALPEALAALKAAFGGSTEHVEGSEDLLADAVHLATRTGDPDTARVLAGRAAELAADSDIPHRQANALHCRGLLDHDAPRLLAAADRYQEASRPLLRAMALEAAAEEFIHVGDRGQARAVFTRAVEVYTSLGASYDVARIRATLHANKMFI